MKNDPSARCALKPGTFVRVKHCEIGYPSANGLLRGDLVRILAFDHGFYAVEQDSRQFKIFMTNIAESQPPEIPLSSGTGKKKYPRQAWRKA
ncbi:MAG TPA: hypothetical protein VH619_18785 [Verrucomicrobiae bacterium]|nr:hypothetical protein [Verrucomicrobiae bacterium]